MRRRESRCFLSVNTQFENVGDALINRELVRLCSASARVYIDTSRCPSQFRDTVVNGLSGNTKEVSGWFRLCFIMILSRVAGYRCFYFLSPGGYVGDRVGFDAVKANANTLVLWFMASFGVTICHMGVSYERIGPSHARILQRRSKLISHHYVRDNESNDYARSLGLIVHGEMPDLAFAVPNRRIPEATEKDKIALSFRVDQGPGVGAKVEALVKELDGRLDSSFEFHFICQVKRDRSFMEGLASVVRHRRVSSSIVYRDIDECFEAYNSATHVVSNRLHSLLIGLSCKARPVPIVDRVWNRKIIGLFSGEPQLSGVVDMDGVTAVDDVIHLLKSKAMPDEVTHRKRVELSNLFEAILVGDCW